VGGPATEVFKRCGSAFRAEGWKALEELGAVGGGELAKLASWARGAWRLVTGTPLLTTAAYVASSCCRKGLRVYTCRSTWHP